MVGAFPVFKLGTLALKQISKPVVNFLKQRAKSNTFVRRVICLPPAQLYHLWETRLKLRILGLSKPKAVAKLSEEAAVDLGAEMFGELLMFLIGAGILALEYKRQARKEVVKECVLTSKFDGLTNEVNELHTLLEMQDAKIRELIRIVSNIDPDLLKSDS